MQFTSVLENELVNVSMAETIRSFWLYNYPVPYPTDRLRHRHVLFRLQHGCKNRKQ